MSRLRPAMSAPRRPTNATSAPSTASHAAMLAPEPPPCIVTVAGVSLPFARGSAAWATVSVIRSPTTTTRVMIHHLDHWTGVADAATLTLGAGLAGLKPNTVGESGSWRSTLNPPHRRAL